MILSVFLAAQSIGERIFIGVVSSLFLSVVIYVRQQVQEKKKSKEYTEKQTIEIQKKILTDSAITLSNNNFRIPVKCYSTLYEELKEKCNPINFMNPYDAEKINISNDIFSKLDSCAKNIYQLIQLRNRAIRELGISFSSKEIYEKLSEAYNPIKYTRENYDSQKLKTANQIYSKIQSKKNDLIGLEEIARDCGIVFVDTYADIFDKDETTIQDQVASNGTPITNGEDDNNYYTAIIWAIFAYLLIFICIYSIIYYYT